MKKIIVVHSGGMDSSLCLALATKEFGRENVLSLSFDYKQRHQSELKQAAKICLDWGVDHKVVDLTCLTQVTSDALTNTAFSTFQNEMAPPNTLVVGRNGLMARLAAIHAQSLGADHISLGVIENEEASSGYRDCSRRYMDMLQEILQIDLANPRFMIRTPLIAMNKKETLDVAHSLGLLPYLLRETITCYNAAPYRGCLSCPSCKLKNEGLDAFLAENPDFALPLEYL